MPILVAANLVKEFDARGGFFSRGGASVKAVENVSLSVHPGSSVGIVGESGCGKTTLGRLLTGLTRPTAGSIHFEGADLHSLSPESLREKRRRLQIVFQDPMGSLNPRMRVGKAAVEPMIVHRLLPQGQPWQEAAGRLFSLVGLDPSLIRRFPHELSGGQRQRVCIARALSTKPSLLVADEPVASLDISIQTQILTLLARRFRDEHRALVLISHDVRVVRALADRIVVMYLGRIVEQAPSDRLLDSPLHPYTRLLIDSVPAIHPKNRRLVGRAIPDFPRSVAAKGCPFAPRCSRAKDRCRWEDPPEIVREDDRRVRCFFPLDPAS